MKTPDKYLIDFETSLHRLIEQAGVKVTDFFGQFPSMRNAKWATAKLSYGREVTAARGAAEWFAECIKPQIERMEKRNLN